MGDIDLNLYKAKKRKERGRGLQIGWTNRKDGNSLKEKGRR
jgi:hypothetical protein